MARCFGCLLALVILCPRGGLSGDVFLPRDTMYGFEDGLGPFQPEQWVNGSTWISYKYEDLDKEFNGTAPRPPEGGEFKLAKLNIKGVSAGSFMTFPRLKAMIGMELIFDYLVHSSVDRAASIHIEYQAGESGYVYLAEFYAPRPNDGQFHTAYANFSLENPQNITIRIYGNGQGGRKPDIVAIDNFGVILHFGFEEWKEKPVI